MNKTKTILHTPRMRALVAAGALVAGLGLAATANATPVLHASVGGVPNAIGTNYANFDNLAIGSAGGTSGGIMVSFAPDAQTANGSMNGLYAAPYLSNGNGADFGNPNDGPDTTNYLASGATDSSPGAAVTLQFTGQQKYFGLLWGSVDAYNTLTFYSGGVQVGQFTGNNVSMSAGTGNCTAGNQGQIGTCYVNIDFGGGSYDEVVATSTQYAFEFDNVAYNANNVSVPEPGVAGMFTLGLLLLGSGYWLKRREHRVA